MQVFFVDDLILLGYVVKLWSEEYFLTILRCLKTITGNPYPDAPHGFHANYRPSYRKEAAEDGWKQLLDWFKR